jgi:hypothetical protein
MRKIKLVALLATTVLGFSLSVPVSASADVYCSSFGTFSSCVDNPNYKTPTPAPVKPLPVWVCRVIYTAQTIVTVIPGGGVPSLISRIIFVPVLTCVWSQT